MKNLKHTLLAFTIACSGIGFAQNDQTANGGDEETLDTSKPTNFYSFIDNTLEYSSQANQNVFGYRGKVTLALSEAHMLLAEVPLLYNDRTEKIWYR